MLATNDRTLEQFVNVQLGTPLIRLSQHKESIQAAAEPLDTATPVQYTRYQRRIAPHVERAQRTTLSANAIPTNREYLLDPRPGKGHG